MIEWCNQNQGFISALLTLVTILLAVIAIVVSISTARKPFKKKLLLSTSLTLGMVTSPYVGNSPTPIGYSISASNIGNRAVNITYLGFAVKIDGRLQRVYALDRDLGGKGVIQATETRDVQFLADELIQGFSKIDQRTKVFACVEDSEGKVVQRSAGAVGILLRNITR